MLSAKIHDRGDARIDAVLQLSLAATQPRPLAAVLRTMCELVSGAAPAEIVSFYRPHTEGDETWLVMRANVGFPAGAVDNVRLRIGEGLTGLAAEAMRPVSTGAVTQAERNKPFAQLDEAAYPVFLAVPVRDGNAVTGVLVLQRSAAHPFGEFDVAFIAALSAAFSLALTSARQREQPSAETQDRSVRLVGEALVEGARLGRVKLIPNMAELAGDTATDVNADVGAAFDAVERRTAKLVSAPWPKLPMTERGLLVSLDLLVRDERLKRTLVEASRDGGPAKGLEDVARRYALTPYRVGSDDSSSDWLLARARDVADLCNLVAAELGGTRPFRSGDAVLLPQPPGGLLALHLAGYEIAALAVGEDMSEKGLATELLRAADIPTVVAAAGLFDWARDGDPVLVDGNAGAVRLHPTPAEVARVRSAT